MTYYYYYYYIVYCNKDPREPNCEYWTNKGPITLYEANFLILIHGWGLQLIEEIE